MENLICNLFGIYIVQLLASSVLRLGAKTVRKNNPAYIGRKTYLIMIIPIIGIAYSGFCFMRHILEDNN